MRHRAAAGNSDACGAAAAAATVGLASLRPCMIGVTLQGLSACYEV